MINGSTPQPPEFLNELQFDINKGATIEQVTKLYPELNNNTQLIGELYYDMSKNKYNISEISKAYPELSTPTQPADTPIFKDQYLNESTLGQTSKALPRAALDTGINIASGAEGMINNWSNIKGSLFNSIANRFLKDSKPLFGGLLPDKVNTTNRQNNHLISNTLTSAKEGLFGENTFSDTFNKLSEGDITTAKNSTDGLFTDITSLAKNTSQTAFNVLKAPLSTGINLASELPVSQYVTQGLGAGIKGVGNLISDVTGVDKKITSNVVQTGLNLLGLKTPGGTLATASKAKVAFKDAGGGVKGTLKGGGVILGDVAKGTKDTVTLPAKMAKGIITAPINLLRSKNKAIKLSATANKFTKGEETKFNKMHGVSSAKFAIDRGMLKTGEEGTNEALTRFKTAQETTETALGTIKEAISTDKNTTILKDGVKIKTKDLIGDTITLFKKELKQRTRHEYSANMNKIIKQYESNGQKLTHTQFNEMKKQFAKNHPFDIQNKNPSIAEAQMRDMQNDIRLFQQQEINRVGGADIKNLNKETQGWAQYSENMLKKNNVVSTVPGLSLTDVIALTSGDITGLSVFFANKALKSQAFRNFRINFNAKGNIIKQPKNYTAVGVKIKKPLALPVGKTKTTKNIILPSKKPIILKAKPNKPIISTTKSKPSKLLRNKGAIKKEAIRQRKLGVKTITLNPQ